MAARVRFARTALLLFSTFASLALLECATRAFVTVREIGPSFTVYDPILGVRNKPRLDTERIAPEFHMRVTTNSLGQRGPEPELAGAASRPRVVFVGDSFTFGYGVDDGEEFPRRLAESLRGAGHEVEVSNEGVGNTGTGRALRRVRGLAREPRRVSVLVHQFCSNDFDDDLRDGFFALDADGRLVEAATPVPISPGRVIQPALESIPGLWQSRAFAALLALARSARATQGVPIEGGARIGFEHGRLTERLIAELVASASERGFAVIVLSANGAPELAARIGRVARESGAEFVAMPSQLERPDLYYAVDGHWNAAGHAQAADLLREPIERALSGARRAGSDRSG